MNTQYPTADDVMARIEAVKQAIAEGRFHIDSDVVADKLLATVRELLACQQTQSGK